MGLFRAEVTEEEFIQEMQELYPDEYSGQGLRCLYHYLVDDSLDIVFNPSEIHADFTEYRGLRDYNTRTGNVFSSIDRVPCAIQFAELDGFFQN